MKFNVTNLTGTSEILKFPDGYVALAVTVDDTGIVANADGKKIVPKGTIVGGAAASVLADANQKVQKKNTASVAAKMDTGVVANNNAITWTAKKAGVGGNSIKVLWRIRLEMIRPWLFPFPVTP
jgi:phage tail sheath gpL-like